MHRDNLRARHALRELGWLRTKDLVQVEIDQPWDARCRKRPARHPIRYKLSVNVCAKFLV